MPLSGTPRRLALAAGLSAVAMAWATAGQAAVLYDFQWFTDDSPEAALLGAFQFTAADFLETGMDVAPADLDACTVGLPMSSCATQTLDPDSTAYGEDGYDVVVFRYDQAVASRLRPIVHFFEDGALRTEGVHEQILSDYISRLTVTIVPASAPEPATWALMVLGFGLAGAGLRRRVQAAIA